MHQRNQTRLTSAQTESCMLFTNNDNSQKIKVHLNENDVLFGRGGRNSKHSGNRRLRALAREHKQQYSMASKKDKTEISRSIVSYIRSLTPPGRFLKQDKETGLWEDVGDDMAKEKTSQALRDAETDESYLATATYKSPKKSESPNPNKISCTMSKTKNCSNKGRHHEGGENCSDLSSQISEKKNFRSTAQTIRYSLLDTRQDTRENRPTRTKVEQTENGDMYEPLDIELDDNKLLSKCFVGGEGRLYSNNEQGWKSSPSGCRTPAPSDENSSIFRTVSDTESSSSSDHSYRNSRSKTSCSRSPFPTTCKPAMEPISPSVLVPSFESPPKMKRQLPYLFEPGENAPYDTKRARRSLFSLTPISPVVTSSASKARFRLVRSEKIYFADDVEEEMSDFDLFEGALLKDFGLDF